MLLAGVLAGASVDAVPLLVVVSVSAFLPNLLAKSGKKWRTPKNKKFVHIMDIEGNKIELWEPNDIEYEKLGVQMGSKTIK